MFDWGGRVEPHTLGTFDSEEKAQAKLEEVKTKILSQVPDLIIEDYDGGGEFGKGFSYGHPMGSMTFIPGAYSYVEWEVR